MLATTWHERVKLLLRFKNRTNKIDKEISVINVILNTLLEIFDVKHLKRGLVQIGGENLPCKNFSNIIP